MEMMNRESYIERLKESNRVFGISNDYLEGKKAYEDMDSIEKADTDFIRSLKEGVKNV